MTASITIKAHGPFVCHPPNHYCGKNSQQFTCCGADLRAGRPTFHACLRKCKEWLVLLTWICRHERHMLSSRICQLQWQVLWGFLFRWRMHTLGATCCPKGHNVIGSTCCASSDSCGKVCCGGDPSTPGFHLKLICASSNYPEQWIIMASAAPLAVSTAMGRVVAGLVCAVNA
jgi:hypothetical protein